MYSSIAATAHGGQAAYPRYILSTLSCFSLEWFFVCFGLVHMYTPHTTRLPACAPTPPLLGQYRLHVATTRAPDLTALGAFRAPPQLMCRVGCIFRGRLSEGEAVQSPVDVNQSVGSASGIRGNSWGGVYGFTGRAGIGASRLEGVTDGRRACRVPYYLSDAMRSMHARSNPVFVSVFLQASAVYVQ